MEEDCGCGEAKWLWRSSVVVEEQSGFGAAK